MAYHFRAELVEQKKIGFAFNASLDEFTAINKQLHDGRSVMVGGVGFGPVQLSSGQATFQVVETPENLQQSGDQDSDWAAALKNGRDVSHLLTPRDPIDIANDERKSRNDRPQTESMESEDSQGFDFAKLNLGEGLEQKGDFARAVEVYREIIARNPNDPRGYNGRGNAYVQLGEYEQALQDFKMAADLCQRSNNPQGQIYSLNKQAKVYELRGAYDNALQLLDESLQISKAIENPKVEAEVLYNLGRFAYDRQDYDTSRNFLDQSLAIRRQLDDQPGATVCLVALAQLSIDKHDSQAAKNYANDLKELGRSKEAQEIYEKISTPSGEESPTDVKQATEEEITPEDKAPPKDKTSPESLKIPCRALADKPSSIDLLNFADYADALADFITDPKTEKPLTIGIDAAWGMGKTTLMEMIQTRLERRSFPTVWFNAWKYDKEESLWAALVLKILADVRKKFNWLRKAKLYILLNWKRLDKPKLLMRLVKSALITLIILLLGWVALKIPAIFHLLNLKQHGNDLFNKYLVSGGSLGIIFMIYYTGKEIWGRLAGPFELKISQYIKEPNYKEKVGFADQFESDFKQIIDAVTGEGKWPLMIFIDDLDRCEPPKPVEIIEAINTLLDAKNCVFVMGMDCQAVAASIEAKYKDLRSFIASSGAAGGLSLGQRFLEKILQINFHIPGAEPLVMGKFISCNLEAEKEEAVKPAVEKVVEAEQLITAWQRSGKSLDEAAQVVQKERADLGEDIVRKATKEIRAKTFSDSEEVQQAVREALPYLEFNPRKIKRFINLFRLQALISNRRGLIDNKTIQLPLLAKWSIISTRWPDIIGALIRNPDFYQDLLKARNIYSDFSKNKISQIELEAGIRDLSNDPLLKRLFDEPEFIALLEAIPKDTQAILPYLCLAQISEPWKRPARA